MPLRLFDHVVDRLRRKACHILWGGDSQGQHGEVANARFGHTVAQSRCSGQDLQETHAADLLGSEAAIEIRFGKISQFQELLAQAFAGGAGRSSPVASCSLVIIPLCRRTCPSLARTLMPILAVKPPPTMSQSMSRVREPEAANDNPRAMARLVLPEPGMALVTASEVARECPLLIWSMARMW